MQAAPAVPQVASARGAHMPSWQQPLAQVTGPHAAAGSIMQSGEQPSPGTVFASSHSSTPARFIPSPHTAGGSIVTSTSTNRPRCSVTDRAPLLFRASTTNPSTRRRMICPARLSGKRIATVSSPFVSRRGGSGSMPGGKAGVPSMKPAILNTVNPAFPS